jgi:DNA-binding winged helix-turn-helix (wHTH) protein/TolB-like protein
MDELEPYIYEFDDFRLDPANRVLLQNGEPLPLTPRVFDTLLYFVRHHGRVLEKDELMSAIWPDSFVTENNLSHNISTLRRLLGERRGVNHFIVTVPGIGYRFAADVRKITDSEAGQKTGTAAKKTIGTANEPSQHPVKRRSRLPLVLLMSFIAVCFGVAAFYLWWVQTKPTSGQPARTIVVLPFKPVVVENRDQYLEMGMDDTLITRLSNIKQVIVRPMSAVRKYAGLEQDALAAGREQRADAVLEGSIQKADGKIRVTARLINVEDGTALWVGTFDERVTDMFAVQDAISERVVSALALRLSGEERRALTKRDTEKPEAYELYLKGRNHLNKLIPPEVKKSIQFFQQAVEVDPSYALAYAGLAEAYHSLPINSDVPPKDAFPLAKAAAAKALEIDESLARVHASLSMIKSWYDWDWTGAELEAKRAIALNPNLAEAHRAYALLLSTLGRHQEAIAEGARARELDPLSPIMRTLESLFLYYDGRNDEAREKLTRTLEMEPSFWIALLTLARVDIRQGRYAEALELLSKSNSASGGNTQTISMIGYARALAGDHAKAQAALDELKTLSTQRYVPPYTIALIYNGLGEDDEACIWLERACEERDVLLAPFIKADPIWGRLHAKPRFAAILKRMNLE